VTDPDLIEGKRVLVVEDGPTVTHGGMTYGAGSIAAREYGAAEIVDPRPYATGSIRETYRTYPHIGPVLPAVGYSPSQIRELEATISRAECDIVVFGTPTHLDRILSINKPALHVRYAYKDHGEPYLEEVLVKRLRPLLSDGRQAGSQ
jgi:predicted GTPase